MREFQEWTRADIRQRFTELEDRKRFLDAKINEFETMPIDVEDMRGKMPIDQPSVRESIVSIRRTSMISAALQEQTSCTQEQQRLNVELHIRDNPALTAQLGPGRD